MPKVTYKDVFNCATKLSAHGIYPTARRVRDELGRGSITTIHGHLSEWKKIYMPRKPNAMAKIRMDIAILKETIKVLTKRIYNLEEAKEDNK